MAYRFSGSFRLAVAAAALGVWLTPGSLTAQSRPAADMPAGAPAALNSLTTTVLPRGLRLTLELSSEVSYQRERLANPDRLFLDFDNTTVTTLFVDQVRAAQSPLIKSARLGSPRKGVTRLVFDLTGQPRFSVYALYNPFRVVIELESAGPLPPAVVVPPASTTVPAASPAAAPPAAASPTPSPAVAPRTTPSRSPSAPTPTPSSAVTPRTTPARSPSTAAASSSPTGVATSKNAPATPTPTPVPTPARTPTAADGVPAPPASTGKGDYSLSRQLGLRVAKIVIDPGHGGYDPGAVSNGVAEAELVLDIALRLEHLLQSLPGVEVVLTRRTDTFVPLERRTAIANREQADLFLSIHANSYRTQDVSGVETYFLNFATNSEAEAVAARENAASAQTMGTLPTLVKAITLHNKIQESRELATFLQASLMRQLRTAGTDSKDLGVKQAPFVVLIGAEMPSVLTEIGFVTNKPEADALRQAAQRQHIAQALRDGIVRYQDSLKRFMPFGGSSR